ncbi:hypothetical protein HZS_7636 [Henneguya salminicola]|nr:hypothetical protein HZS_7636 [Henneguya salminicola]
MRSSVQFCIWDQLRKLEDFKIFSLNNLSDLLTNLLLNGSLKISILKILDFNKLTMIEITFYIRFFTHLLTKSNIGNIKTIFVKLSDDKWNILREDILYFLLTHLHNDTKLTQSLKMISCITKSLDPSLIRCIVIMLS